jgi:4-hydroxybenzoate polyprenyltransferase
MSKIKLILDSIKFEHTIFALPYAYIAMLLASDGIPTLNKVLWITVAMGSARTLAMSSNRIIDRHIDKDNPRTSARHLPSGKIQLKDMQILAGLSMVIFFLAASQLNYLCLLLSPVAALIVVFYPYTKRFTWGCHFVLGFADGIAPAGAWIAITGSFSWEPMVLAFAVATWIGGFDILYSCQDYEFDVNNGLYSLPQRFGIINAMNFAKFMHFLTIISFVSLGVLLNLHQIYYIGCTATALLLIYEHKLVSPTDLTRIDVAFFNINGYIAVVLFICTLAALYV